jgi:ABC-type Fe3+ transport system permease subunit
MNLVKNASVVIWCSVFAVVCLTIIIVCGFVADNIKKSGALDLVKTEQDKKKINNAYKWSMGVAILSGILFLINVVLAVAVAGNINKDKISKLIAQGPTSLFASSKKDPAFCH